MVSEIKIEAQQVRQVQVNQEVHHGVAQVLVNQEVLGQIGVVHLAHVKVQVHLGVVQANLEAQAHQVEVHQEVHQVEEDNHGIRIKTK